MTQKILFAQAAPSFGVISATHHFMRYTRTLRQPGSTNTVGLRQMAFEANIIVARTVHEGVSCTTGETADSSELASIRAHAGRPLRARPLPGQRFLRADPSRRRIVEVQRAR